MSKSKNRAELRGNVGSAPERRQTASGTDVTTVSLATNARWTDKAGNQQERTEWHRLVFWGKQAEQIANYVSKGDELEVEGEIRYRPYTDAKGVERYMTEIHVSEYWLSSNRSSARETPAREARVPALAAAGVSASDPFGDDSDLPF